MFIIQSSTLWFMADGSPRFQNEMYDLSSFIIEEAVQMVRFFIKNPA